MFNSKRRALLMGAAGATAVQALTPVARAQSLLTGAGGGLSVVSASNRTRLGRNVAGGSPNASSYKYLNGNTLHTTSVAIAAGTMQPLYSNAYVSLPYDSVPAAYVLTIRGAYITNVQGLANIGTTGASLNQTGATITPYTFNGVVSGATQLYGDTTGANCAQPRTYAQFLSDGGSVKTALYTNDTLVLPPGYLGSPDAFPNALAANTSYILRIEQFVPINTTYMLNSVQNYSSSYSPSRFDVNATGDYSKAYTTATAAPQVGSTGLPMVYDPNWSTYSGVVGGTNYDLGPIWVTGNNPNGAKTQTLAGCSINEGNLDYGDIYGTCGLVQRALFSKNIPQNTTAIVGSTLASLKGAGVNKAAALRMLAFRIFTANGGDVITDDGRNDSGLGWPAAGTYTAASANDTSQPSNDMAAIRWANLYLIRPNMPSSSKLIRITSISPGTTGGAYANAVAITGATYNGLTITYQCASTTNLTNGITGQVRGLAPSSYNAYGVVNVLSSTSFSITNIANGVTVPTAAPTTATGYLDDGGQNTVNDPANSNTSYIGPGGNGYLMNDYSISRNSYAGQTLSKLAGDHDACLDCDGALGYYALSNPAAWPNASQYQSETPEFTHVGWAANQRAYPAVAAALAGVL